MKTKLQSVSALLLVMIAIDGHRVGAMPFSPIKKNAPYVRQIVMQGETVLPENLPKQSVVRVSARSETQIEVASCTGIVISQNLILTSAHCLYTANIFVQFDYNQGQQTHQELPVTTFRSGKPLAQARGTSPWVDNYLPFDQLALRSFREAVETTKNWINVSSVINSDLLADIAILKISQLPANYKPISFATRPPVHKQQVAIMGYGVHTRKWGELFSQLRFSDESQVIGYAGESDRIYAWQTYSPKGENPCFGDSGGPLLILEDGEYKLMGILTISFNGCANSALSLSPHFYMESLKKAAQDMHVPFEPSFSGK